MQRDIVMSAGEAVRIIVDCDTIATSGVVGSGRPEARAVALEACFLESGMRRGLTLVHAASQGDRADRRIFQEGRIDLRRASRLMLADRVRYDADENILFLNFECLTLDTDTDTDADVLALEAVLERRITAIGHRVRVIVNDDNFRLARAAAERLGPWWPTTRSATSCCRAGIPAVPSSAASWPGTWRRPGWNGRCTATPRGRRTGCAAGRPGHPPPTHRVQRRTLTPGADNGRQAAI